MALSSKSKTIIGRSALAVVYVVLLVLMFVFGRTHTLLIDNKNAPDGTYKAVNGMSVAIGKQPAVEFMRGDRDKFTVKGQTHTLHIEFFDGSAPVTAKIHIPLGDDAVLLSIPKLLAGIEPYIEPFDMFGQTPQKSTSEEEEVPASIMGF